MPLHPETIESIKLFTWIKLNNKIKYCSFHIPNEGKRSLAMGSILKQMGLRRGVSDYFIGYATHSYHGLWLELKSNAHNAKTTVYQDLFLSDMRKQGYAAIVCYGADNAIKAIEDYIADHLYVDNPQ